jgi:hypothetical protein
MPVSATPSHIRSAAAAAIVRSTNNTRVCFIHALVWPGTHEYRFLYRLRTVRISPRETTFLRVGTKGEAPKDDGDWQDAVPQTRLEAVQEWFQVRGHLLWS